MMHLRSALLFITALLLLACPARAQVVCQPINDLSEAHQVTGAPSGSAYLLDGRGCVTVSPSDLAWFQARGFVLQQSSSGGLFTPPGGTPETLQARGLFTVYVGDYGANASTATHTTTAALPGGSLALTTTAANDYVCSATQPCNSTLIAKAGDGFAATQPSVVATMINGPVIEANGAISTAAATINMSGPPPANVTGSITVFDVTNGCSLGTMLSWPTNTTTLTLTGNASCKGSGFNDFLAFQVGDSHGRWINASSLTATNATITMSAAATTQLAAAVAAGATISVWDTAANASIGTLSTYSGTSLVLTSGASVPNTTSSTANGAFATTVSSVTLTGACPAHFLVGQPLYDFTLSKIIGSVAGCSGGVVTFQGTVYAASFGASDVLIWDALAFTTSYTFYASSLDSDHIDAAGGHSGGGVGVAAASNTITGASVMLGSQNFINLAITPGVATTATAGQSFTKPDPLMGQDPLVQTTITLSGGVCPAGIAFGQPVNDTTLSPAVIIGSVYSCVGGVLALQEGTTATSFGSSDSLSFLTVGTALWKAVGGVAEASAYWVNDAYIRQFDGYASTYNDTGYCSGGACPPGSANRPFNIPAAPPTSAIADWAVRKLTSISGALAFTPATVSTTASAVTIYHDNSDAFDAAIAVVATNGGTIRVPPGAYRTSRPISLVGVSGVAIAGDGRTSTNIIPEGAGDMFDVVGSRGHQVTKDSISNLGAFGFSNQAVGYSIFARYVNGLDRRNLYFSGPFNGEIEDQMNATTAEDITQTVITAEPVMGFMETATQSAFGNVSLRNIYVGGQTGSSWPNLSSLGVGYDINGGPATVTCLAGCQAERIPGSGMRLSDDRGALILGNQVQPQGTSFIGFTSEFQPGHAIDAESGIKTAFTAPQIRSGGNNNFLSCPLSATFFNVSTSSKAWITYTSGQNDGGSGDGVFINGSRTVMSGAEIFNNSAQDYTVAELGTLGPLGSQGMCHGVEVGALGNNNIFNGNVIGAENGSLWQVYPILFDAGSANNSATGNNLVSNLSNYVQDNGTSNTVSCNNGSVNDCASAKTGVTTLGVSSIPFVLTTVNLGANGAFGPLGTALDQQYPNAYFYLLANTLSASNAAGWYYCTMPDASNGTCFSNAYAGGVPTVPASPTACNPCTGATSTPALNTQYVAYTQTIAGGLLGANDGVDAIYLATVDNNANSKKIGAFLGGAIAAGVQSGGYSIGGNTYTTVHTTNCSFGFRNAGVVTAQIASYNTNGGAANASACGNGTSNTASSLSTPAANTANNALLNITMNLVTAATDYIVLNLVRANRSPSP